MANAFLVLVNFFGVYLSNPLKSSIGAQKMPFTISNQELNMCGHLWDSLQVGTFVITIFIFCFLKCSNIQCILSNAKFTLYFLLSDGKSRVILVQHVNRDLLLFISMCGHLRYDLIDRPGVLGNYVSVNYHYLYDLSALMEGF